MYFNLFSSPQWQALKKEPGLVKGIAAGLNKLTKEQLLEAIKDNADIGNEEDVEKAYNTLVQTFDRISNGENVNQVLSNPLPGEKTKMDTFMRIISQVSDDVIKLIDELKNLTGSRAGSLTKNLKTLNIRLLRVLLALRASETQLGYTNSAGKKVSFQLYQDGGEINFEEIAKYIRGGLAKTIDLAYEDTLAIRLGKIGGALAANTLQAKLEDFNKTAAMNSGLPDVRITLPNYFKMDDIDFGSWESSEIVTDVVVNGTDVKITANPTLGIQGVDAKDIKANISVKHYDKIEDGLQGISRSLGVMINAAAPSNEVLAYGLARSLYLRDIQGHEAANNKPVQNTIDAFLRHFWLNSIIGYGDDLVTDFYINDTFYSAYSLISMLYYLISRGNQKVLWANVEGINATKYKIYNNENKSDLWISEEDKAALNSAKFITHWNIQRVVAQFGWGIESYKAAFQNNSSII